MLTPPPPPPQPENSMLNLLEIPQGQIFYISASFMLIFFFWRHEIKKNFPTTPKDK